MNGKPMVQSWEAWVSMVSLAVAGLLMLPEVTAVIPAAAAPYVLAVSSALTFLLRVFKTSQPIVSLT